MSATIQSAHATCSPSAVIVTDMDGTVLDLPHLWLRDNCACSECRVTQTGEKRFMIHSVPVTLIPDSVDVDADNLRLVWPDGHRTQFSLTALRALGRPRTPPWQPWPQAYTPARVRWDTLLGDAGAAVAALTRFVVDGALVITHAPMTSGALEDLAPRLGPIREMAFDRIHDVQVDPGGYNVAHTAMALPPHNDFASYMWPPSVQALHMLTNDARGGQSIIVDGFSVLRRFRARHPQLFETLCTVPVPFSMVDDDTITWASAPLVRLDADGDIAGLRFSNQLMRAMDPGQPDVGRFYCAYHELCRQITGTHDRVKFRLKSGQVLLVAAHRVLHAREAFTASGRRHLQDAYFELDNIVNQLILLQTRQANGDV